MRKLLLLLLLTATPAFGTVIQIVGTLVDSSGSPVSGTACFRLPVNAVDTSTSRALSPRRICFPVTNGTLPAFATVVPNDVIQPAGTFYQAKVTDQAGGLVFMANYVIPTGGGTFNIGTAIPTAITTNNISYAAPVLLSANNVFTGNQTFNGNDIFNGTNVFNGAVTLAGGVSGATTFTGAITAPAFIANTASPATTGIIRLTAQDQIVSRNLLNTLDVPLIWLDSQGFVEIGNSTVAPFIGGASLNFGQSATITGSGPFISANGFSYTIAGTNGNGIGAHTGGDVILTPGTGINGGANGKVTMTAGLLYYPPAFTFAALGTPANGALVYCSDCTIANPCAGAGTGSMAKRLNGIWVCN